MATKYILAVVAAVFLVMGGIRASRAGASHPQARAWLLGGALLGVLSAWLWLRQP